MAPRRKAAESRKSNQATLQFGSQSKISKPFSNASIPGKDLKQKSTSPKEISLPTHSLPKKQDEGQQQLQEPTAEVTATPASTTSTAVVHEQARAEAALPKSKEDEQAEALTLKQLHAYWRAEERKRTASRANKQQKQADRNIFCQPCIGIARIKRWRRAHALGLNPPIEVLAVLLKGETREKASEKAYIDELLS
ncbi:DNA polymerase delta subunit 4, putative [Trichophyton benhamiae CBS 112371]|uniref:DNA polymerase delta subunit 4, putative n=1 Tax=Arthroderma benhamiae (strain ATCC MYA-4681 / CBS 112371) TaxID=663331 RepID=D4B2Q7_ARTBC|nr:DNA polymerase delta subunit 4, putative [Trichophyton benhamiae CBS 112371]EFE30368.1 DNA polymerase delta subunit 4, putative [Trichophyton benhamiae CBS 112371]